MTTTSPLVIRVLGPLEVDLDGRALAVGGPQQRRLLALLVVHRGRVVGIDRIIEALWPEGDPPDGANRSVLTYVSRLRAVLPAGTLTTVDGGYRLEFDRIACDVDEFDRLATLAEASLPDRTIELLTEALAWWRGSPFGEFGDEYWAVAEAARLDERRAVACEERAAALLAIGHHARAVPDLEEMVRNHPIRERPVELLMQALRSAGRQAEAIRAFQRYRRQLADETGLQPSPALQALCDSMFGVHHEDSGAMGRPLRGYTILEAIGEGAFGRVYSAIQPATGRTVAIKAIRPDLADSSEFIGRFEREAQLVARLEHPHIVPLYDYWREPGGAYLVFRLLPGGTARDASIADGAWSVERVGRLVEEIGGALMAAHAIGVAHNDVSASNVLLDDSGAAYLSDFGIAVVDGPEQDGTDDGMFRRDVRALGRLAWELLAGEPSPQTLSTADNQPRLIGRIGEAPVGLDKVLARATARDDGYASVAEFVLAWRAMIGRPDGSLSPINSDELRRIDSARRSAADRLTRQVAAGTNPYKGLRPFDEADAAEFFGRTTALNDLLDLVARHPLVAVVGASGSGKSSLVRAGLAPALRSAGWAVVLVTPGEDPVRALDETLLEVSVGREADLGLAERCRSIAARIPLQIIFDQFEECWTLATEQTRDRLLATLVDLVESDPKDLRIVLTIPADSFDLPLQHPTLGHLISAGCSILTTMSPAELDEAIVRPAARAGVSFDEAVVAALIDATAEQPGSLPMLQFTLRELYDRRVDARIGRTQLEAVGGMSGVIARRAEEIHEDLDPESQDASRALFARLVAADAGSVVRRPCRRSELSERAAVVADRYVAARLLVADRDGVSREPTVAIAHDALLAAWPRLAGWVRDDQRWIALLGAITSSTRLWDEGGRVDPDLMRGARLEAALEAVADGRELAETEQEFVAASRQHRDAEIVAARLTARRLRRLLVAVGVVLVVAIAAGAVAVVQRGRAQSASSIAVAEAERADAEAEAARSAAKDSAVAALVGRVGSTRATQRDTAALLAIEAFRLADTPETRSALLATFTDDRPPLDTHRYGNEFPQPGLVMPDGETAFQGDDGLVRDLDLETGARGEALPAAGDELGDALLRSSPDGRFLAQVAYPAGPSDPSTTIAVYDLATRQLRFEPIVLDDWVVSATFSADGTRLLLDLAPDGRVIAVDTSDGRQVAAVAGVGVGADGLGGGIATVGEAQIVAGSSIGLVRVLDSITMEVTAMLMAPPGTTNTFRSAGDVVIGSGPDGIVRIGLDPLSVLWSQSTGACENLLLLDASFFCGDGAGAIVEHDIESGRPVRVIEAQNGNSGSLWAANSDTELVSFTAGEQSFARWRLDGSGPVTSILSTGWLARDVSPDGTRVLLEKWDGTYNTPNDTETSYQLVDRATGVTIADLPDLIGPLFLRDGSVIGAMSTADGIRVARLDESSGQVVADGPILDALPDIIAADPGKQKGLGSFVDGSSATLRTIDPKTLQFDDGFTVDGWVTSAISRAGDRIVVGTGRGVEVYDPSGAKVGSIPGVLSRGVYVTPADQLFVATLSGELVQYDLESLSPVRTFDGSLGFIQELYGTSDGSIIAVRGLGGMVSIFDVDSGIRLGTPIDIPDSDGEVSGLSLDGNTLVLGGGATNGVQVWDLRPQVWIDAACRIAGRNLTDEEWNSYIGDLAGYHSTCPEFAPTG
jgi:DNA-binding SARP family transcriptional activator/WD40 repeat protein/tRNA A-37 threonylcarbamoyl transferase component Bud32